MDADTDRQAFSRRLNMAIRSMPNPPQTSAQVAVQFNLRSRGTSVSPQAVHKWLTGQSFPAADKLKTLSEWLNVPIDWLRHGIDVGDGTTESERLLLSYFRKLDDAQQLALLNLMATFTPSTK